MWGTKVVCIENSHNMMGRVQSSTKGGLYWFNGVCSAISGDWCTHWWIKDIQCFHIIAKTCGTIMARSRLSIHLRFKRISCSHGKFIGWFQRIHSSRKACKKDTKIDSNLFRVCTNLDVNDADVDKALEGLLCLSSKLGTTCLKCIIIAVN